VGAARRGRRRALGEGGTAGVAGAEEGERVHKHVRDRRATDGVRRRDGTEDVPEALSGLAARGEAGAAGGAASVPEAGAAAGVGGAPCGAGVRVPPRVAHAVTAKHTCLPSVAPGTSVPPRESTTGYMKARGREPP